MNIIRISKLKKVIVNRGLPTRCLTCKTDNLNFSRYAFYSDGKVKKMSEGESVELVTPELSDVLQKDIDDQNKDKPELNCYVVRLGFCNCGEMTYDLYT